jgi:hypothetical protein
MEYAIFISKVSQIELADGNFSRLYFGNEFCQELVPTLKDLELVLDETSNLKLTLVTPYVTNGGLKRLTPLFEILSEKKSGSEVVFNDWGVFRILKREYPKLKAVMGRLLNKVKRGPRLCNVLHKIPSEDLKYFRSSNLSVKIFREFLLSNDIKRVEFDNLLQGFNLDFDGIDMSLYLPFVYVTTTRYCLVNSCDIPHRKGTVGIFPCNRECQKYTFYLESEVMPVILIRKGNTLFFRNETTPEVIDKFSRIVIEPEIPM